ncbi:DUF5684 domain-containing protein [Polyangium sp. y55x31]|uniref:DUF5684 domain-containing protein n=1 Tax=Polyangium sp. y55x31 TaxID=3042688 RepID=UPI0024828514|nr:DUF5684 domain-containing protein [Polyangium sp. y55x31]MDI1479252.1 DUF5684 domain-containing protein [Polyangium sp. y55x31]
MGDVERIFIGSVFFAVVALTYATMWGLFKKANHPGWACFIPLYNAYVLLDIAGMSGFWLLVMLMPYVNIIVPIIMAFRIAAAFRKGSLFGLGLLVLPFVFYPLLAFRKEERWYGAWA